MHVDVKKFQDDVESGAIQFALGSDGSESEFWDLKKTPEDLVHKFSDLATKKAWEFFYKLMAKYQNGYIVYDGDAHESGYPTEWLEKTGEYNKFQASHAQFNLLKERMTKFQKYADSVVDGQDEDAVSAEEEDPVLKQQALDAKREAEVAEQKPPVIYM